MNSVLYACLAFLFAIAILIAFHELGHFWVARRLGVKVLKFSIGFGKSLWRWQDKTGTEFVISAIPLGGYVRMLDENEGPVSKEELSQAFNRQSVWTRMAIVAAGPLANLLFAVLAYWLMFVIGVTAIVPVIGSVLPESAAAKANIHKNNEIVAIDGKRTPSWMAVRLALLSRIGENGKLLLTLRDIHSEFPQNRTISLQRELFNTVDPAPIRTLGITPYIPPMSLVVASVLANGPAAKAGMMVNDEILRVDNQRMEDWFHFVSYIKTHAEKPIRVIALREAKKISLTVTPNKQEDKDGKIFGYIGIQSMPLEWPANMQRELRYSFFYAWLPALEKTGSMTLLTFKMLGKMVVGQLSLRAISGPIGIAQAAGQTASIGFPYYLSFLALVSISLGVLNMLPIPLLDGGHFFYYVIELLRGRPVSAKTRLIGTRLGISLLLGLTVLAVYNDVIRLFG